MVRMTKWGSRQVSSGWSGSVVPDDVLGCLQELGIEPAKITSGEVWALCPGHPARLGRPNNTPNKWSVNLETGEHSCFSCGFKGSFSSLVQEVTGYDRHDADEWVRSRRGGWRLRRVLDDSARGSSHLSGDARIPSWSEDRLARFASAPSAALASRGVSSGAVDRFGVRWNAEKSAWILPIRSPESGELWGYQEKGSGWFGNRPAGVRKSETLFGLDAFEGSTAILLESPLDCIRLYTVGMLGGVSSYGVHVSTAQLNILFDIAHTVIFALDNDEAGINKSRELREKYLRSGRDVRFADYSHIPWAKDLGTEGVTAEDIHKSISSAKNILTYGRY